MATLFLEVGTPAVFDLQFLQKHGDIRGDNPSQLQSDLPTGIEVGSFGMRGTPEDMDSPPYQIAFVDSYNNVSSYMAVEEGPPTVPPTAIAATAPVTELDSGTAYEVDIAAAGPSEASGAAITGPAPTGMEFNQYGSQLTGTPTAGGEFLATFDWQDMFGDPLGEQTEITFVVHSEIDVIPVPAAERTEDGYMLPDIAGVIWTVDDVETLPGSYSVHPVTETTTVTILPIPDDGYAFDEEPEALVLTFEPESDPDPEPEPEPTPGPFDPSPAPEEPDELTEAMWARLMDDDPQAVFVATRLAERVVTHVGRSVEDLAPTEVLTARDHSMTVLEYVRGYTRERGFVGYVPHRSLQAVIVSAGARLFANPEQLAYYSTGDYSERPATLTGWTHAELGVLRRFRRTYQ